MLQYIALQQSGTWVARAVAGIVEMSARQGHAEFAMEPTDVYREIQSELDQWRIDLRHALELRRLYPRVFADPAAWESQNPEPQREAA
jgi:hypothetical protein